MAFWIQLDGAESAGVIAAMLALQTRGQVVEKSICCFLGTIVGGAMAIVIVGLFAQTRDLYVLAYSAWLAVCVFAAGFLDGNRAYGAVVCGYTVSIVAVIHIDDPASLFSEVINRCAAIAIGIASIILVIDVFAGPDLGPTLLDRIQRGITTVRAFTDGLLRAGPDAGTDAQAAALLSAASNQHLLLNALPAEAVSGSARAGAVRATLAALVGEIRAARALALARTYALRSGGAGLHELILRRLAGELHARQEAAAAAYAAALASRAVADAPRMPIYRSREGALRNALRAFVASALTGFLLSLTGWSMTAFAWAMVGVIVCLSSNAPDPGAMTKGALIGLPAAVVLGGITQFVLLSGVDAFPLLMIGTAPALLGALLVTSSHNPALTGAGLLTTVYTIVVLQPSNPQSYDPQTYLLLSILLVLVAVFAFVLVRVLFPTGAAQRRRWVLASVRQDMHQALRGIGLDRPEDENRLLDASRIGTLASLEGGRSVDREADLAMAFRMTDLARAARRVRRALHAPPGGAGAIDRPMREDARAALEATDGNGLRRVAGALLDTGDDALLPLAADMAWTADLIDAPPGPGGAEVAR
ncbi:FUSC family protein [Methylobacterium sp. E-046]|nr:FUSC family protein [Methylobacterium sp. E-046]